MTHLYVESCLQIVLKYPDYENLNLQGIDFLVDIILVSVNNMLPFIDYNTSFNHYVFDWIGVQLHRLQWHNEW